MVGRPPRVRLARPARPAATHARCHARHSTVPRYNASMRRIVAGVIFVAVLVFWTVHLSKGEPLPIPPGMVAVMPDGQPVVPFP
jgi:hypothetical protein